MRWYLVYTKPRMERWARTNLWERGFDVYLPQYRKRRRHARRIDTVNAPLFSRYIFLQADLAQTGHRVINSAPGVVGLVDFGGAPALVSDRIIDEIRTREHDDGYVRLEDWRRLQPGDSVRLTGGPLSNLGGLFSEDAGNGRIVVLLNLLGRTVRAQVAADSIGEQT